MASVWLSDLGPEQASGWQGRVYKLRLLHRDERHLNILISIICPPPHLMLVTKQASLCTATSLWLWLVSHVGLRWIYLFGLCVSLLDATEDSAELPIINLLVDDGWHSFVPLPKLPAWPRLPAQGGCWQEQLFDVNGRGGHLNKMYHGGSFDVSDEVCHLFGNNWYIYQLCILLL